MQKNLYYQTFIQRKRPIEALPRLTVWVLSIPKMVLEVFIRRNFGERYFNLSTAMLLALVLAIIPVAEPFIARFISHNAFKADFDIIRFLLHDLTWYLFLAGFIAMCIDRQIEISRSPGVFDFQKFSLSTGEINPFFLKLAPFGKPFSVRTIETMIEPGYFLVIGLVLWLLQQHVGILITVCSFCYWQSYTYLYKQGDHFVMDQIDEMICNQQFGKVFIEGLTPDHTKGFTVRARTPADPSDRRKIVENLVPEEKIAVAL